MITYTIVYRIGRREHEQQVKALNARDALMAFKKIMPEIIYKILVIEKIKL